VTSRSHRAAAEQKTVLRSCLKAELEETMLAALDGEEAAKSEVRVGRG